MMRWHWGQNCSRIIEAKDLPADYILLADDQKPDDTGCYLATIVTKGKRRQPVRFHHTWLHTLVNRWQVVDGHGPVYWLEQWEDEGKPYSRIVKADMSLVGVDDSTTPRSYTFIDLDEPVE